ncbi:bifunctional adenosine 5'-phosphosulfate phosphorylase/adenylylsulfatase HINT4 isoform X1 [Triticum urartu]|uniref:bifunctional adenosine 5'-phosphosulfate phosphorylase/adenylylsulfatase HINT4 isoform X1 n=1 Tax=Triticum urartu TaxID=4572 RepID=UPI002044B1D7|nr:bifunctional adenosine 5'-phosphosulfate phosphorylase/adenylylsulfatase HINT4 isoform X1 [Triticum urartu]
MKKSFCFRGSAAKRAGRTPMADWCVFCDIARRAPASTAALLYSDDKVVAFQDINPSAFSNMSSVLLLTTTRSIIYDQLVHSISFILKICVRVFSLCNVCRHYLVIPIEHIPTVKNLQRTNEDHQLVSHMVKVGKDLLSRDAPKSEEHRFGFHQPPFNSIDHLHLHCLALPFIPSWRQVKYTPLGPLGGFIDAEKVLEKIKPETEVYS